MKSAADMQRPRGARCAKGIPPVATPPAARENGHGHEQEKKSKVYVLPKDRVVYNYRYFLPYAPEWGSPELCRQRLQELLAFCRGAQIDAVQFFVNTLPGTYYMPPYSAREQAHWAAWMKEEVAPALRRDSISYQLNFQMLLGAGSKGLDMREKYPWDFLVNQHGEETLGCACPISPGFREAMGKMLRLWAATDPDILWIDDDFRMHGHGLGNGELDCYCYCERHLVRFAEFAERSYAREELVREVLKPGEPGAVRQQWLDFLGTSMTETAAWIRQQVQGVSPRIRLALMTSVPDVHAIEGRDWRTLMTALSGEHRPMVRPCSGCYTGTHVSLKYQANTFRFMAQTMATLERALGPGGVDYGPELENAYFTTWCKSVANTRHALFLGQLLGCPQITLSTHDLEGSPLADEPTIEPLLQKTKPALQALADLRLHEWTAQGVVFLNDPDSARKYALAPGQRIEDLGRPIRDWEDVLLPMGIPARYAATCEAAGAEEPVVLERYTAWSPSDQELKEILSGAVLLDGGAAEVLQERGFGKYLGVEVAKEAAFGTSNEVYADGVLPGLAGQRVPHRSRRWNPLREAGARVLSHFTDAMNRRYPGSTIFENPLGGRVAVYSSVGDFAMGTFGRHARLRWLHALLRWLSRDTFPILAEIPHHGLTVARIREDQMLLAFANLGTDVLEEIVFRPAADRAWSHARVLDPSGAWRCAEAWWDSPDSSVGRSPLRVRCRLNAFEWLVLLLERSSTEGKTVARQP